LWGRKQVARSAKDDHETLLSTHQQDADTAERVFSIFLPAAGLFAIVTSPLLFKSPPFVPVLVMVMVSFATTVTSVMHNYAVQYVTMAMIVFNRFFLFALAPFLLQKLYGARGIAGIYGMVLFIVAAVMQSNYVWQ